ncbi:hypothetical protein OKW45_007159 [Paraburkholderia sp. WSM4175]|uniref:hypothetical protein n=1 Tax=Paraburkholderia sp. WSM4175 TaxID=2991072 RepID=UPI003D25A4BA
MKFWHPAFQEGAQFLHLRRFVGIFRSDEVIRVTTSNGGFNGSSSALAFAADKKSRSGMKGLNAARLIRTLFLIRVSRID